MNHARAWMLTAVLALLGCEVTKSCTEIGCGAPLNVEFDKASRWPPGNYTVEVKADGVGSSCTVRLPFGDCTMGVAMGCDGQPAWRLGMSGCALPMESHSLTGVTFNDSRPASVTVSVLHEQQSLGTATFTPNYVVSRPNGPECEPECRTAAPAKLTLP